MNTPKRRYAYELILEDRPDLKFDLEQLRDAVVELGDIDLIALELELMGSASATAIRTNALRLLAKRFQAEHANYPASGAQWLWEIDPRIGGWSAIVCARIAVQSIGDIDGLEGQLLSDAERYLRGEMPASKIFSKLSRVMRQGLSHDYAAAYAARSCLPIPVEDDAEQSVINSEDSIDWTMVSDDADPWVVDLETQRELMRGETLTAVSRYLTSKIVEALPTLPVQAR